MNYSKEKSWLNRIFITASHATSAVDQHRLYPLPSSIKSNATVICGPLTVTCRCIYFALIASFVYFSFIAIYLFWRHDAWNDPGSFGHSDSAMVAIAPTESVSACESLLPVCTGTYITTCGFCFFFIYCITGCCLFFKHLSKPLPSKKGFHKG